MNTDTTNTHPDAPEPLPAPNGWKTRLTHLARASGHLS